MTTRDPDGDSALFEFAEEGDASRRAWKRASFADRVGDEFAAAKEDTPIPWVVPAQQRVSWWRWIGVAAGLAACAAIVVAIVMLVRADLISLRTSGDTDSTAYQLARQAGGVVAAVALLIALWSLWLPVEYEVASQGLRRRVLNRTRLVPWHAIRAYQLRPTGVLLYQRGDPASLDVLRSMFIPFPSDADELLTMLRHHASHAIELPQ